MVVVTITNNKYLLIQDTSESSMIDREFNCSVVVYQYDNSSKVEASFKAFSEAFIIIIILLLLMSWKGQ